MHAYYIPLSCSELILDDGFGSSHGGVSCDAATDKYVQSAILTPFVFLCFLQVTALVIEALTWCSMTILILLETKVYIRQFRWVVRFGVIYVLVADVVLLNLLLSVKDYCSRLAFNFKANSLSFHFLLNNVFFLVITIAII